MATKEKATSIDAKATSHPAFQPYCPLQGKPWESPVWPRGTDADLAVLTLREPAPVPPMAVATTDPAIGERGEVGAAIYLASAVYLDGALAGHTMFEPITSIENGRFTALSGKASLRMSYR